MNKKMHKWKEDRFNETYQQVEGIILLYFVS